MAKNSKPYNRETALNAALHLFWTKGYHATSLKDLEEALKMKPGSIYAAFKSKENLYALALEQYFNTSQAAFYDGVLGSPSPLKGLVGMIRAMGHAKEGERMRRPCMLIKAVVTATDDTAETAELARGYRKKMDQNMVAAFEKAQEIGELSADADAAAIAQTYQTDVTGLQIDAQMGLGEGRFQEKVETVAKRYESLAARSL